MWQCRRVLVIVESCGSALSLRVGPRVPRALRRHSHGCLTRGRAVSRDVRRCHRCSSCTACIVVELSVTRSASLTTAASCSSVPAWWGMERHALPSATCASISCDVRRRHRRSSCSVWVVVELSAKRSTSSWTVASCSTVLAWSGNGASRSTLRNVCERGLSDHSAGTATSGDAYRDVSKRARRSWASIVMVEPRRAAQWGRLRRGGRHCGRQRRRGRGAVRRRAPPSSHS